MPARKTTRRKRAPGSPDDLPRASTARVDFEVVAAVVPVGQDDPLARRAVDDARMPCGAMRVAVAHPRHVAAAERLGNGAGIDVENGLGLARGCGATLA